MRSVCIFCGSNTGAGEAYATATRVLARAIVGRGLRLIYGGGSIGLMGVLGAEALAAGGHVIGGTPRDAHRRARSGRAARPACRRAAARIEQMDGRRALVIRPTAEAHLRALTATWSVGVG